MQPRLDLMEDGIAPGLFNQLIMGPVFHHVPALDGDDPVGMPHGG